MIGFNPQIYKALTDMYISKRGERQPENWLIYFHRIDLSRQEDGISVLFINLSFG